MWEETVVLEGRVACIDNPRPLVVHLCQVRNLPSRRNLLVVGTLWMVLVLRVGLGVEPVLKAVYSVHMGEMIRSSLELGSPHQRFLVEAVVEAEPSWPQLS